MRDNAKAEDFIEVNPTNCVLSLAAGNSDNVSDISKDHKQNENGNLKQNSGHSKSLQIQNSSGLRAAASETKTDTDTTADTKKRNILLRTIMRKNEGRSKRQILILIVFAFVEFFAATVISIQAPFFPHVADNKSATAIEVGLVFGIFELTVFIMSPIFGAKMNSIGPKKMFNWGIFTTGACCVIFGFLNHFEGRFSFIGSCFIVRVIEAVGDAAFVTASFTIIALEFPDSVATTFATMETFYGLGMIVGPILGGALYEVGGYSLPFILMGGLLFVSAMITYFLLPDIKKTPAKQDEEGQKLVVTSGFEMFKLLRFPSLSMIAYSIVATACGVGFLSATLERHLDRSFYELQLSKFYIGAIFILNGGVYALTAPVWGWICDHSTQRKYITLIGSICTIIGFMLVGPLPILPFETSLWGICIGLVFFGLGLGATLVSAFIQALHGAIGRGYPDDVGTYGLVSGLWTSMTALGFFVGSTMGGLLDHYIGFRSGTLFVVSAQLILIGFLAVYFFKKQTGVKKSHNINEIEAQSNAKQSVDMVVIQDRKLNAISNPAFENDEQENK